ncbi:hypothetical protein ASG39_04670 [Rhizobium sp. Leaf371]|uniref:DUF6538 domain-containing protein n=1 Tax=Rhizobium sp. Leaf371 TaxID=1736355 RepID=UPI0007136D8B|nr:DUF6538 domain-containing protein [Rhizobium sp. Leaf371]KQS73015.1 hypothetical protein ASG39_04670 [Rhizobium sp. Leaf371]
MRKASVKYLNMNNGWYYVRLAVPKSMRSSFGGRREIQRSLKTREYDKAILLLGRVVDQIKQEIFAGDDVEEVTIADVMQDAEAIETTYSYMEVPCGAPVEMSIDLLSSGLHEISETKKLTKLQVARIGGVIEPPALTMRQALERFELDSLDLFMNLAHRERQKKFNKYRAAVTDWEKRMGADLDVLKLDKTTVFNYRTELLKLVSAGELKTDTIRKTIMWLRVIVRHAFDLNGFKESPFEGLKPIKGKRDEVKRETIEEAQVPLIRQELIDADANEEIRAIVAVLENTGARPKEITGLHEDDIHLDAPIPYIRIRANCNRELKNTPSERDIPLVGVALEALKRFPKGFPRYSRNNGSDAFGAAVNKHIEKVAPGKTSYSYRHRLAYLMNLQETIKDTMSDGMLGHAGGMTAYYGKAYPLHIKLEVLKKALPDYAY